MKTIVLTQQRGQNVCRNKDNFYEDKEQEDDIPEDLCHDDLLDHQDNSIELDENDDFILTKKIWETIVAEMYQSWTTIPSVYCHPPCDIMTY